MNLKNRIIALVTAAAIAVPAVAIAKYSKSDKGKPTVTFNGKLNSAVVAKLVGPLEGTTNNVTINDDDKVITFVVDMSTVTTKKDARDTHYKKAIVGSKKDATLKVNKDQLKGNGGTANGELTLNGQPKGVKVKWTKTPDGDSLKVVGTMNIRYTDWYDGDPEDDERRVCKAGVCVEPDLEIKATLWVKE
jgi:polyisoprenoid-binding protein YceI